MIIKTVSQPLLKEEIILSLAKAAIPSIAGSLDVDAIFRKGPENEPSTAAKIILAHVVEHKPKATGVSDELVEQFRRDLYSKDFVYFSALMGAHPLVTAMLFTLMNQCHSLAAHIQSLESRVQALTQISNELRSELDTVRDSHQE